MYTVQMTVTPTIAQEFLTHNVHNREKKVGKIRAYSKAMREGKWQLNPEGISFYENGDLRDGQNRCYAVIDAGVPVEMSVTYDVPNESIICDMATPRSMIDILNLSNAPKKVCLSHVVASARLLFYLCGNTAPNPTYIVEFCEEEADYLADSYRIASKGEKYLPRRAPILAAVYTALRAGVPEQILDRFCHIVGSGFYSNDSETSAIIIRNKILEPGATQGKTSRDALYRATLRAICDFATGVPRKKTYKDITNPPYFSKLKEEVLIKYI